MPYHRSSRTSVYRRPSIYHLSFTQSLENDASFKSFFYYFEQHLLLQSMIYQLKSRGRTPPERTNDLGELFNYILSNEDEGHLKYQSQLLSPQDWIRQHWKETVYRYLSIFHHTYDSFLEFDSKKLLQIKDDLRIPDEKFRIMIVFLIISSVIDENDSLYVPPCEYFKEKPDVELYDRLVVRLLRENYALAILSGGFPDGSVDFASISEKVEADIRAIDVKKHMWLNKMIDERLKIIFLKRAVSNITHAMMDYLVNKKNSSWFCIPIIQRPCLVHQTLIKYYQVESTSTPMEVYELLYERLFKPKSDRVIQQYINGAHSHYLPIMQAFNYPSERFSTFEQSVTRQKDRINRQCSDGDIVISVFHQSNNL